MPTLSPRTWIAIALLTVLAIGFGVIKYQNHEIADLNKENGAATAAVTTAGATVAEQADSHKADDKAVADVAKKGQEVRSQVDKRVTNTHNQVQQIEKEAAAKPDTPENQEQTAEKVSEVRITAMWDAYCAAKVGAEGCPASTQPTQEKQDDQQQKG